MVHTHKIRNFILLLLGICICCVLAYFFVPGAKDLVDKYVGRGTSDMIDGKINEWGGDAEDTYISSLRYGSGINSGNIRKFTEMRLEELMEAVEERDSSALKEMLAEKTASQPGVQASIGSIMDFIDGEITECSYKTGITYSMNGSDITEDEGTVAEEESGSASGSSDVTLISGESFFFATENAEYYCQAEFLCRDDAHGNEGLGLKKLFIGTIAASAETCSDTYGVILSTTPADGYALIDGQVYTVNSNDAPVTYSHAANNFVKSDNRSWAVFQKILGTAYVDTYWEKIYRISDKKGYYLKIELKKEELKAGEPDAIYKISIVSDGIEGTL